MKCKVLLPIIFLSFMAPNAIAQQKYANTTNPSPTMNQSEKDQMDAIEIIKQDHNYIIQQFALVDKNLDSNVKQSRSTFKDLKDFIIKHETMEQKVWYPELEKNSSLKEIIATLKEQEEDAGKALKNLDSITDDREWATAVKKFKQAVMEHANDEQSKLFPKVQAAMDKQKLNEIGKKLMEYRKSNNMNNMKS